VTPPSQERLQHALDVAYRFLGRRDRTVAEVRGRLEADGIDAELVDGAIAELTRQGYLDDARYAQRFAEDKRELDRWGSERIARELHRRGVADELIEAAVADRSREAELQTALLLLQQRAPSVTDDRERDRAWRLLVRRGYEAELAYEAVRRHEQGGGEQRAA
jgi:regulatory protein